MTARPTYEELEKKVRELERAAFEQQKAEVKFQEKEKHLRSLFNPARDVFLMHGFSDDNMPSTFARDIIERKRTEEALLKSEARYMALFDNINTGVAVYEARDDGEDFIFLDFNKAAEKIENISKKSLLGKSVLKTFPAVRDFGLFDVIQRVWKTGNPEQHPTTLYKDQRIVGWRDNFVYKLPSGEIVAVYSDETARQQALQKQREGEERLRSILDSVQTGIIIIDSENHKIAEANPTAIEMIGDPKEKIIGSSCHKYVCHEEPGACPVKDLNQEIGSSESLFCRANGDEVPVLINIARIMIGGKEHLLVSFIDITERKKLEAQLQQAQKMESIGTLAGGIAHDFNNILSPIMMHAEMAMMELPPDSPIQGNIRHIYKASERARDLVKQILTFARRRKEDRIPLKTSLIVMEAVKFLRSTIPSTITIQYDSKTEQDTVLADPTQMNQIVMNLCTNAAHAMRKKGGILEINLENEFIRSAGVNRFDGLAPGHYLRMSVSDTGPGIPPGIIDKIFEPYFTTKDPGEGTGMGLALIHGIVKSYGGDIRVESKVGQRTTFHVRLPVVATEIFRAVEQKAEIPGGRERILFIDDEETAVAAIQSLLARLGYQVTARTNSLEALRVFRSKPRAFDLVITDMTMPHMTGKALAGELMSIRPDIPVILCTGYSEQIDEKTAREMGIRAFVMKPIVMKDIAETIREVFDQNPGHRPISVMAAF